MSKRLNLSLLLLAAMVTTTLASSSRLLAAGNQSTVSWDAKALGEVLGAIWKTIILILLVLQFWDAISRYRGKAVSAMHTMRFVWFIYGTAVVYTIGPGLYRTFNDLIFSQFSEEIFQGYYGSKQMKVFKNVMEVNGTSQEGDEGNRRLIENILFFELIIFIGLRVAALITAKGVAQGNPVSHLLGSLRRIAGLWLCLFNFAHALGWYQYIH